MILRDDSSLKNEREKNGLGGKGRETERERETTSFSLPPAMLKTFSLGAVAYKGVGVQTQGI